MRDYQTRTDPVGGRTLKKLDCDRDVDEADIGFRNASAGIVAR